MTASTLMTDALGFTWDQSSVRRDIPRYPVEQVTGRFQRSLPEYVRDSAASEGNPLTYPEVRVLLDGITVGGRKVRDEHQILNLAGAAWELLRLVRDREFRLARETSDRLHHLLAWEGASKAGHFGGEGSQVMAGPDGEKLRWIYAQGVGFIRSEVDDEFEQAVAYFLFAVSCEFYRESGMGTALYMMNGHLMSHGMDVISVPAARREEFETTLAEFLRGRDGTGMFGFLTSCRAAGFGSAT
jgi:hypothetical protein